jgi:hypothetical protein
LTQPVEKLRQADLEGVDVPGREPHCEYNLLYVNLFVQLIAVRGAICAARFPVLHVGVGNLSVAMVIVAPSNEKRHPTPPVGT